MEKKKYRGVALIGTTAALIAWILLAYGIFTVQSSQFEMLISSRDTTNAQKLAEVDASLLKMVNYENITNNSALSDVNLHLERGAIQSIPTDGWQDEIIISEEKLNSNDPDYGRFRVATINIYQDGDTEPRFSMQVPITKSRQTYSRNTIDEFIEALREKDRQLEAKDRELEAKDRQLEAKDNEISAKIDSVKSSLLSEIDANRCTCTGSGNSQQTHNPSTTDNPSPSTTDNPSSTDNTNFNEPITIYLNRYLNETSHDHDSSMFTFTAPSDGYIKIVPFEDDGETIESSGESGSGSYNESYIYLIDGKVVVTKNPTDDSFYLKRYGIIKDGDTSFTTYEGETVQLKYKTVTYDDGEGYSWDEDLPYWDYPRTGSAIYRSGVPISKGSVLQLERYLSVWSSGDGSFDITRHYGVYFIPQ